MVTVAVKDSGPVCMVGTRHDMADDVKARLVIGGLNVGPVVPVDIRSNMKQMVVTNRDGMRIRSRCEGGSRK